MIEVETDYFARPAGSQSKLSTYKDGFRILLMIVNLIKEERPLYFFSLIFVVLFVLSLLLGIPILNNYLETGLVPRMPSAILSMGMMICAVISLFVGFILDSLAKTRKENRRLAYLNYRTSSED